MRGWVIGSLGVLLALTGCAGIAPPNWCHPGSAAYQRAQAQRMDPFPETDVGPEIVGGRPRDFQKPQSEPTRVQTELSYLNRYKNLPPGLFRASSSAARAPVSRYAGVPGYAPPGTATYPYVANPTYPANPNFTPAMNVASLPGTYPNYGVPNYSAPGYAVPSYANPANARPATLASPTQFGTTPTNVSLPPVAQLPPTLRSAPTMQSSPLMSSSSPPTLLAPPLAPQARPGSPTPQGFVAPSIQQGGNWIGGQAPRSMGPDAGR